MSSPAHIALGCLWGLLFASVPCSAQNTGHRGPSAPVHIERLDGLSHNTVFGIVQDRRGFLWIGTSDGLNRYDGYDFITYRHDPRDPTSLANNTVRHLLEDQTGVLWVGTDGGLQRLDHRTGRFVQYRLLPDTANVHRKAVMGLLEDRTGTLWVGIHEGGVYRYDRTQDRFERFQPQAADSQRLASTSVMGLYEDRTGAIWMSTVHGTLHQYRPETHQFRRFSLSQRWEVLGLLHRDLDGRLWIRGMHDESGALDPANGRITPIPGFPEGQVITAVLGTSHPPRWVGTTEGMYRYDVTTSNYTRLNADASGKSYLQNVVRTLYEDRAGTLWIGTLSGLYHVDPHAKPFLHVEHDPTDPNSLSDNTVMAVWQDTDGIVWVGTLGGGLNRFDRETDRFTRYRHQAGNSSSLCSDLIWSLYEDRQGRLWIGTDEGVCALDRATQQFTRYTLPGTKQPPVNAVREDRHGRLWIASNTGLYRIDPQKHAAVRVYPPKGHELDAGLAFIQSLHIDQHGFVWMGTHGGTFFRLVPETGAVQSFPLRVAGREMLVSEGIWAIHEDASGMLWLGSDLGLTRLDPRTGALRQYTQRDGLPGSIVYGILEDDRGRLWLSTNRGLARFDRRPNSDSSSTESMRRSARFRTYDAGDGLKNVEFNRRAAFKGAQGEFFFGGLNGLTAFFPDRIQDNPYIPPVVFTQIRTSNRDTTVTIRPESLERLVLSYRDYAVSFEFAALSYTNPARNQYAYRLEGFDESWIQAGTRRFAQYTNLPAGDYVFRVRGSNDDGRWNEVGAALPVTVHPPFWKTWWFRLLFGGLMVGLLTLAYRYRMARVIEMERMRLRIASDLHDDIGSNLSSIALLSDMVRGRNRLGKRERRQLSKVSRSARAMVEALRDIVWSIDPEADQPGELVQRMKDTAATLLGDITWSFRGPDPGLTNSLDMNTRRHVFLIYKEVLHNIIRHAEATEVSIRLEEDRKTLRLTVSDDGTGFDVAAVRTGNGLRSLAERAAKVDATLDVQSAPGAGTTVHLVAPIRSKRRKRAMRGR